MTNLINKGKENWLWLCPKGKANERKGKMASMGGALLPEFPHEGMARDKHMASYDITYFAGD